MKKILAYFGLVDGDKITPIEQENFAKHLFVGLVLIMIIIPILIAFNVL